MEINQRVVITGATSIIGIPLIKKLLEQNYKVYAVMRPNSTNAGKLKALTCKNLEVIELDLKDGMQLINYIKGEVDICVHLGWEGAGSENRKKREVQQENVQSSMIILKACEDLKCKRFIFSGSQAEYGQCVDVMQEDMHCSPVSEYGKAKVDFMNQALAYLKYTNTPAKMQYIHMRIFSIYGTDDHENSLINSCIRSFLEEKEVALGKCEHMWNYLYITDLINAFMALITMENYQDMFLVYNIAGEEKETKPLKEYVQQIYASCGNKGKYLLGARVENAEGANNLVPDITKIMHATGWKPEISFTEGIRQILEQRRNRNV